MSWEAYAWTLLAAVLVGGFAWYERSRPPARMVALVAALAALAVAGRLVFTPIPNVVATTDIVLITGFAVGAAPGFAVGALAAAISNLWLGQGPWTPWEMAGWGMVGLGGAALGAVTGRRIGRYGLAVACGFAGFAYGALLDYSVMVSYGGEQSLDRYLAISARGVPFNVAHAAGNVVLALAAGPALVRMIARYRERFEFRWRPASAAPLALLVVLAMAVAMPARANAASAVGMARGRSELGRRIRPRAGNLVEPDDDRLGGPRPRGRGTQPASPSRNGGATPLDYLRREAGGLSAAGDLERTILAVEGAGASSRRFGGRDLPSRASPPRLKRRLGPGPGQPHRLRHPRAALSGSFALVGPEVRQVAARRREPRRGLGIPGQRAERRRQHGGGLAGHGRRRRQPSRAAPWRRVPAPRPGPRRGVSAGGNDHLERPVHRVGDPGPGGGGREPVPAASARPLGARVPLEAPARRRSLHLLGVERPDSGLGHGPGARRSEARGLSRPPGRSSGSSPKRVGPGRGWLHRLGHDLAVAGERLGARQHHRDERRGACGRVEAPAERGKRGRPIGEPEWLGPPWNCGTDAVGARARPRSRSARPSIPRPRRLRTATPTRPPTSRAGSQRWRSP